MLSNVIVFVSLFLGIVTGRQTIAVAVSENVASVRILVDNELVHEMHGQPWRISHDFGPELTTRELTAIALNEAGREIGRAVQQLNVPRARVEAEVLLEEWVGGSPTMARLLWHSAEALEPQRASVTLDAVPLEVSDFDRIELPALDPDELHFLTAEIVFPDRNVATAEVVFGGAYGASVQTELTAVPLMVRKHRVRSVEATRGWLRHTNGTELTIVAVEEGPGEVAIVREDEAMMALARIDISMRQTADFGYKLLRLDRGDRLRFVSTKPSSAVHPTIRYDVFPISRAYGAHDGTLPELLAGVLFMGDNTPAQKLTDAVAIAGRYLVESQKRRVVLVITRDCANVSGRYSAKAVRRYLTELHVPLRVWQVGGIRREARTSGLCNNAEKIYTGDKYAKAVRRLREELKGQQLVWVRGRPLPREITLTSVARGVQLAGN